MRKISILLFIILSLFGCNSEKYEPSILLGSHYKSVKEKLGTPLKEHENGLIYDGPIGKKAYDYDVYFSKDEGYFYNKDGTDDNKRIDLIRVNIDGFLLTEDETLELVNELFLNNTAEFKLLKRNINKEFNQFSLVTYTSENIGNLKDVGIIFLTLFTKNGEVESFDLTSCNNDELYKVLIKNND